MRKSITKVNQKTKNQELCFVKSALVWHTLMFAREIVAYSKINWIE